MTPAPKLAPNRAASARIVSRSVRQKLRRDDASAELGFTKAELIEEAKRAGVTTLVRVHPRTGQRVVLSGRRTGTFDETAKAGIIDLLGPIVAEDLFPIISHRGHNWDRIDEFLTREHPKNSNHALAARQIAAAVENNVVWTQTIYPAEDRHCLHCDVEIKAPEIEPLRLCPEHRKWYNIGRIHLLMSADDPAKFDLPRFNRRPQRRYRQQFLTKLGHASLSAGERK